MSGITAVATVTVDIIVPKQTVYGLSLLLIQRGKEPFAGMWALPGGKLNEDDSSLEYAACRELMEETGLILHPATLQQIGTFGDAHRDPRGRYISVAFLTPVVSTDEAVRAGDDAAKTGWWNICGGLPPLAFDHRTIILVALRLLGEEAMHEQ